MVGFRSNVIRQSHGFSFNYNILRHITACIQFLVIMMDIYDIKSAKPIIFPKIKKVSGNRPIKRVFGNRDGKLHLPASRRHNMYSNFQSEAPSFQLKNQIAARMRCSPYISFTCLSCKNPLKKGNPWYTVAIATHGFYLTFLSHFPFRKGECKCLMKALKTF